MLSHLNSPPAHARLGVMATCTIIGRQYGGALGSFLEKVEVQRESREEGWPVFFNRSTSNYEPVADWLGWLHSFRHQSRMHRPAAKTGGERDIVQVLEPVKAWHLGCVEVSGPSETCDLCLTVAL